jgi:hypothetical protein
LFLYAVSGGIATDMAFVFRRNCFMIPEVMNPEKPPNMTDPNASQGMRKKIPG